MLERLVALVLNNYLGKYIENLNTDQLSIAILSGEVELENLPLRKDALRHLGTPIEIQTGFVGKIKLQIPVRQIRSAPWVINIEKLYILATPIDLSRWDSDIENNLLQDYKLSILDALEAQWRAEYETFAEAGYYASSITSWMNFGTGLLTNIIENLQLKINDVHIRFEDSISCGPNNSFSCGIVIESLSAESCDSNWQRTFTTFASSELGGCSFKLVELQKLGLYFDDLPSNVLVNHKLEEFAILMNELRVADHYFIISPVSAVAQFKRERCQQPLRSKTRPRITCQLTLDDVTIVLTDIQYKKVITCIRGLSLIARLRSFRQWRPNVSVSEDPKAWWYYAVKGHFPQHHYMNPKATWESCIARGKLCKQYVMLYASLLTNPSATLPTESKLLKDQVEWMLDFQQLKLLREAAMRTIPKVKSNTNNAMVLSDVQNSNSKESLQSRSVLIRWFPQWWGSYSSTDTKSDSDSKESFEEEILDVLTDSIENNTLFKRDSVFGQFKFTLNKGSLKLCESVGVDDSCPVNKVKLELQFENVGFSIESRPRTSSHMLTISLGAMHLKDHLTPNTLFPILIAPQGTIREALGPGRFSNISTNSAKASSPLNASLCDDPLFQLSYEHNPLESTLDYRLFVKSQSLEIVYNRIVAKWFVDFITNPLSSELENELSGAYAHMKNTTKKHLINQWEHILQGELSEHSIWQIDLDISAPQIILVENFSDNNAAISVLDLGRMKLSNGNPLKFIDKLESKSEEKEDDDDELFMTPCSTPPGSEVSDRNLTDCGASPIPADTPVYINIDSLNQDALHNRLYERYTIELSDLQVLVGRHRDNWKYANTKGTSSLHILDKFNISIQFERRILYTNDPQYPSVTLCGTLPHLVVHLNEHKLIYIQSLMNELSSRTSFKDNVDGMTLDEEIRMMSSAEELSLHQSEVENTERSSNHLSKLFILQFAVDQMELEVQSRGRSIAEVQVCGVRLSLTKRPCDFTLVSSVHSLLIVDALQTYGPDFELLVASHKHVGMDFTSGSIKDSEPTSPVSPSSPEAIPAYSNYPATPAVLSQALTHLNTQSSHVTRASPGGHVPSSIPVAGVLDSEALIVVELTIVSTDASGRDEDLHIVNILFNNLDIIANQETIVELIGFAKRIATIAQSVPKKVPPEQKLTTTEDNVSVMAPEPVESTAAKRVEVTFDFHRLNILLLRASIQGGNICGKKIGTATLSGAKIHATVGNDSLQLSGSLGGLQIVSLCSNTMHQKILSVGCDPITNVPQGGDLAYTLAREIYHNMDDYYTFSGGKEDKALTFSITRLYSDNADALNRDNNELTVSIKVHMASVWYTHSGVFISELQSCATEFKTYLSNLAKSIRAAATDMAYGLVQTRDSLYSNPKVSGSMEWVSPRKPRSVSIGFPQDSQDGGLDNFSRNVHIVIDIVLDTPVVVLPRSPNSSEVFVAHLGNMSVKNKSITTYSYDIEISDINLYSLDVSDNMKSDSKFSGMDIYSCDLYGKPILHDTTVHLTIENEYGFNEESLYENLIQIAGKVVTPLKVSATRNQYEQMLDTISSITISPPTATIDPKTSFINSTDTTGVNTLNLDAHVKAQLFHNHAFRYSYSETQQHLKVNFQLPIFTVEFKGDFGDGEKSLVDLSFREFFVNYDKCHGLETLIEMSLKSITMEDLSRDVNSRHRFMMLSHKPLIPKADFLSRSNPDLSCDKPEDTSFSPISISKHLSSLPDQLNVLHLNENNSKAKKPKKSPLKQISLPQENLVLISIKIRDSQQDSFAQKYNNVRKVTKIDFNSLDLVISVDSWVVVLDFFGLNSETDETSKDKTDSKENKNNTLDTPYMSGECHTEMSIRSLNVVLLRPQREVCRANISGLELLMIGGSPSREGCDGGRRISGTLSSMSLMDLSPHGRIWRERFLSSGKEALNFQYERFRPDDALLADCDTRLLIEMSSIVYVHTKRFVGEIQAFFKEFSQLQSVIAQARQKVSVTVNSRLIRMQLSIECLQPAIIIPVSSGSTLTLVADVQKLTVNNIFKRAGSEGTISFVGDLSDPVRELLDIMTIRFKQMDLYCGKKIHNKDYDLQGRDKSNCKVSEESLNLGYKSKIMRQGPCLLTDKCSLVLQVERNLEEYHNVADMSIQGTLNTLNGSIDLAQYKVIKGLLSHNLGENIDDLHVSNLTNVSQPADFKTWTLTSIRLDLLNVKLQLEIEHGISSLACINFIKSRLVLETFSDMTQDIDLVSQEILLSDIRYNADSTSKKLNVFSNIVQPMGLKIDPSGKHIVQAEVHARKRNDHSAYTILVNNMRLMAIFDWWQAVNDFIMCSAAGDETNSKPREEKNTNQITVGTISPYTGLSSTREAQFELKLNITESQVVFVEDTSQWDTNAVILKSTTVISYKPGSEPKTLSCVLNHCEVFSCILGSEEETALSIIDPVTIQIDLNTSKILRIQIPQLNIRLSYYDMRMLLKIFQSLPQQTRAGRLLSEFSELPVNLNVENISKLQNLGFSEQDCLTALMKCENRLEQAALWLTENSTQLALPLDYKSKTDTNQRDTQSKSFETIQVAADCISICIIDDCRDSDVPLLEISLAEMILLQNYEDFDISPSTSEKFTVSKIESTSAEMSSEIAPGGGKLKCKLTSDYYNRALSGWEPFIEPWRCESSWEYGLTTTFRKNRLQVEVNSTECLNINITSSFIDLFNLVKTNWTQDMATFNRIDNSPKNTSPGYKRRSPFVPFALHNQTGSKLWFTTILTTPDAINENIKPVDPDQSWTEVSSGETATFKFGIRGKQRHRDSHKLRLHQLGVRIDGWNSMNPVCVDKVGVFFRVITHTSTDIEARLVFDVSLEGSARKLVTVRSALQLINNLPTSIEVRADNITKSTSWNSTTRPVLVKTGEIWHVPLSHNPTPMWIRPLINQHSEKDHPNYLYCAQPIDWRLAARQSSSESLQIPHVCHSSTHLSYRFCCVLRREKFPIERGLPQPGHIIKLMPSIRIVNLLSTELNYKIANIEEVIGRIAPGQTEPLSTVDVQKQIDLAIFMEGFPGAAVLTILPAVTASFSSKLKLSDVSGRRLTLNAYVSIRKSDTIKISISAPYWIVNRTGIPIVFRQEGIPTETAGQFEEHEIARMVAPLLFSFADSDGNPTVVARVGAGVVPNGQPQWSSPFGLGSGIMVRRLVITNIGGPGGPEKVQLVGISIRPGRGQYRHTNICTISPRFQIHNNTSFHVQFSQKCFATIVADPGAAATHINAVPGCSLPFHWPRQDRDHLLCVKLVDVANCSWSGGFRIDLNHSLHINIRDNNATSYFLRLEVVLQGATFFIVFTDADTMPPPIRLDNFSLVHLTFHQMGCKDESLLKAHSSKPWALVEPCGAAALAIRAPGGIGTTVNLQKLDEVKNITYQNFIYIVFTGTHQNKSVNTVGGGVESSQLVLEVANSSGKVVLAKKRFGERSQLWRLNQDGHLLHEGSSPPQPANAPPDVNAPHALVLDIDAPAPQPNTMVGLCVRRVNPRRASTQTWRFTPDGRLKCAHSNMTVQPLDGFFGLREGNRAVLGLPGPPGPFVLSNGIPIEQAVSFDTLRPGSGFLTVSVTTDGPTIVVKIMDSKQLECNWCEGKNYNSDVNSYVEKEYQIRVAVKGIGLSLISRSPPMELLFCIFSGILLETIWSNVSQALNLSVQDLQFDNQISGSPCPVLLHSIRSVRSNEGGIAIAALPTIQLSIERTAPPPDTYYNAHIFKHFIVSLRPIAVHFEEKLLLLLCQWFGIGGADDESSKEDADETDFEMQKILTEVTAAHAKRYYFGVLKLMPSQIRLGMSTTNKLPSSLLALKKRLGLTLIKFEDAGVDLQPFVKWHPFETSQFLWHSILKHFKDEFKWQAAIILGSIDFLGNPLGFVHDVSDGVSGLILEGNVGALVKNVTHGISNSAAKVTESLGDGLGRVILDEAYEETRARIRDNGEGGHLIAGFKGLFFGILGGMTSLVKHSYEGATHQGLPGFFTGVGKGLIGTVTKPVVGVLDLAAETAAAVRDKSRRSDKWVPERFRPPRCPVGPGGLLPRYSRTQSIGHQYLYSINNKNYDEGFLAYDCIRSHPYDIRALISMLNLRIFTCTSGEPHIVLETHLSNLISCQAITNSVGDHYIELTVRADSSGGIGVRRPQIQCDTADSARWVCNQVNYAKCMFHERLYSLQEIECDIE